MAVTPIGALVCDEAGFHGLEVFAVRHAHAAREHGTLSVHDRGIY